MSRVLLWAKPETWFIYTCRGESRAFRFGERRVDVFELPANRLVEHRFPDDDTRNAFLTRLTLRFHYQAFRRDERAKMPRKLPAAEVAEHAKPKKKAPRSKKKKAAAKPRARAWKGDAARTLANVRAAIDALRELGAEVRAKLGKPATAADLRALGRAYPDGVPPSLAAIHRVTDGFLIEWKGDAEVVLSWLSAKAQLKTWRRETEPARKAIAPVIEQYDGCILGLDTRHTKDGEHPVVFHNRLDDDPRAVATSAGAFLDELLRHAFTHPEVPDVAHRKAARTALRLRKLSVLRGARAIEGRRRS